MHLEDYLRTYADFRQECAKHWDGDHPPDEVAADLVVRLNTLWTQLSDEEKSEATRRLAAL